MYSDRRTCSALWRRWRSLVRAFGLIKLGRCQREIAFRLILAKIEIISSVTSTVSMSSLRARIAARLVAKSARVLIHITSILLLLLFTKLPLSYKCRMPRLTCRANVRLAPIYFAPHGHEPFGADHKQVKAANTERSTRTQLKPWITGSNNGNHHRFPLLEPAGERQIIRLKSLNICPSPDSSHQYHTHWRSKVNKNLETHLLHKHALCH